MESGRVPAKGGIRASAEKLSGPVRKNGTISVSTQKNVESGQVPTKGGIRASTLKLSGRVLKMVESV